MWETIEKHLKEKQMSIYELSNKAGINRQSIYALRDGKAQTLSLENAFKLADALDIDVNEFRKEET